MLSLSLQSWSTKLCRLYHALPPNISVSASKTLVLKVGGNAPLGAMLMGEKTKGEIGGKQRGKKTNGEIGGKNNTKGEKMLKH